MSIAGIRSNSGDIYQTLVAFDWALTVLSDEDFQWLEVDSTTYPVDDVVVGKSDGSVVCCQCKKNQTDFRSWSITDLAGELDKAFQTLARNQKAKVCFYSRSEFGAIAKLREYSTVYGNEADYRANFTAERRKTDGELAERIAKQTSELSTYEFLQRTSFEITPNFDRMEAFLRERLRQIVSNSNSAYDAIWRHLDKLGGRVEDGNLSVSARQRLTKADLEDILRKAGAMLVPEISSAQVRAQFASTSAIGRSWHRDIAGLRISSPVIHELLSAIDAGNRTILLTGLPGSGKTCVMLSLQELLEQRAQTNNGLVPLFIQSREFADMASAQEREAQGLSEKWVEHAARLAEDAHVIVAIDSLDVLSIAREHSILTYFLAQIDKLLTIPNVTVITACRDFDRKYDRRIAVRHWESEIQCQPLDWEAEIAPLLSNLEINTATIDSATRDLIRNPRELALFVELAQREGGFSVVTSQALAERYLDIIVKADPALGNAAMQAIEEIAEAMLKSRSLSIPHQRFSASQDILRRLHSLNVLQDTHDGKLTFGHQTLVDVLVISGALRQGLSLYEFIQRLTPVPFVRPSIRSFVAQLAVGDRCEFRKQLRAVLTGSAAFHIRRLVAEAFAQQLPQKDDWSLLRNLWEKHREVFQVIYSQASSIEWHQFWRLYLVPLLKDKQDAEGIKSHIYRVAQWQKEDAAGVIEFWTEALDLNWLDRNRIADQLAFYLADFQTDDLSMVAPLLGRLLELPIADHSFLGKVIARCVLAGAVDDRSLWRYIAGDISEEDVTKFHFDNKLRCQPHEFGDKNDNFLKERMVHSADLLDLAVNAIEEWGHIQAAHYGVNRVGHHEGLLRQTSYDDIHTQSDHRYVDSERMLLDAVEVAILDHARKHTRWWQLNRERLCFSIDGALCYFAIRAITDSPERNLDIAGRLLCDRNLLEFDLSFELSELIQKVFVYLDGSIQDSISAAVQSIWSEREPDESYSYWILVKRAGYISAIPCYLRSSEAQVILDTYEKANGKMILQPNIYSHGGTVQAPFSFEIFLNTADEGVVRLLAHYSGYNRDFDDYLVGGKQEVGWQLREASSRHPARFLKILTAHWESISANFRDELMEGIASYLRYQYGNLRANGPWEPVEEPSAQLLANQILGELERHPSHWRLNRAAAHALEACAYVTKNAGDAARLVFLAIGYVNHREESSVYGNSVSLLTTGINMMTGNVAAALAILVGNLLEDGTPLPELLCPTLRHLAGYEHPAVRALILQRLPYLQNQDFELSFDLFERAMKDSDGLWQIAEQYLYYIYHDHFDKVEPLLERVHCEGSKDDQETWGRLSALSVMGGYLGYADLLLKVEAQDSAEAWRGTASVWTHTGNFRQHRDQCIAGITAVLSAGTPHAEAAIQYVENMFRDIDPPILIPANVIRLFFNVIESASEPKRHRLYGFDKWLNAVSQRDPDLALIATEAYLTYIKNTDAYFDDHRKQFVQLATALFAEAEEREDSDEGVMLKRVVVIQDLLLSLGGNSIDEWLRAAERQ